MTRRRLQRDDYTVGWVCALPIELAAAHTMLDEEHEELDTDADDSNVYTLGKIDKHNVVIACLPAGQKGNNSATAAAVRMRSSFRKIRFGLMVGIGSGVPSAVDIRLGDVVISQPAEGRGGVVQYDFGKATPTKFVYTGFLNMPPTILLNAIQRLRANHIMGRSKLSVYLTAFNEQPEFIQDTGPDTLFQAAYDHEGGPTCSLCRKEKAVERQARKSSEVMVHYGTIASGNQVMSDGRTRDKMSEDFGGVFCFEMEAAGVMNSFPCLVVRGISDYADSHKNESWQAYAAATAAACAKALLLVIRSNEVQTLPVPPLVGDNKSGSQKPSGSPTVQSPYKKPGGASMALSKSKTKPKSKKLASEWSEEEDRILRRVVLDMQPMQPLSKWEKVSSALGVRSAFACQKRFEKLTEQ
jgi:nucleoside phosphorylase